LNITNMLSVHHHCSPHSCSAQNQMAGRATSSGGSSPPFNASSKPTLKGPATGPIDWVTAVRNGPQASAEEGVPSLPLSPHTAAPPRGTLRDQIAAKRVGNRPAGVDAVSPDRPYWHHTAIRNSFQSGWITNPLRDDILLKDPYAAVETG
jgi:hypothetical protein